MSQAAMAKLRRKSFADNKKGDPAAAVFGD
jgi:hypothetical protein